MKFVVIVVIAFAFFNPSQTQKPREGSCRDIQPMDDFDVDKFEGRWYEYAGTPLDAEKGTRCNQFVRYPPQGDQWPISLLYEKNGVKMNFTRATTLTGTGTGVNEDGTRIVFVHVEYNDFALVYACKPVPNNRVKENVWFLTRQQYPSALIIGKLDAYAYILTPVPVFGLKVKNQTGCSSNWKGAVISDVSNQ